LGWSRWIGARYWALSAASTASTVSVGRAASGLPAPFLAHSDPRDSDGDHAVADRDDGDHDHEEDDVQDDEESV
jgi:hypothetical protein